MSLESVKRLRAYEDIVTGLKLLDRSAHTPSQIEKARCMLRKLEDMFTKDGSNMELSSRDMSGITDLVGLYDGIFWIMEDRKKSWDARDGAKTLYAKPTEPITKPVAKKERRKKNSRKSGTICKVTNGAHEWIETSLNGQMHSANGGNSSVSLTDNSSSSMNVHGSASGGAAGCSAQAGGGYSSQQGNQRQIGVGQQAQHSMSVSGNVSVVFFCKKCGASEKHSVLDEPSFVFD